MLTLSLFDDYVINYHSLGLEHSLINDIKVLDVDVSQMIEILGKFLFCCFQSELITM